MTLHINMFKQSYITVLFLTVRILLRNKIIYLAFRPRNSEKKKEQLRSLVPRKTGAEARETKKRRKLKRPESKI